MSNYGFEMWGFVASVVGTIFLTPHLCGWLKGASPSARMRDLEDLLSETEGLLRSALEEGTIEFSHYDRQFYNRMWRIKFSADELRAEVYNIKGYRQELVCWLKGLSSQIATVIHSLNEIRGDIATSSSKGREKLEKMYCTANPTLVVYSKEPISHRILPIPPPNIANALQPPMAATALSTLCRDVNISSLENAQRAPSASQHLFATDA